MLQVNAKLLFFCLFIWLSHSVSSCRAAAHQRNKNSFELAEEQLGIRHERFNVNKSMQLKQLITDLDDKWRWWLVLMRRANMRASADDDAFMRRQRAQGKLQRVIPKSQPFPCNLTNTRSPQTPTSVHRLRPGDIDVIAVIGDSISAGNGLYSENILQVMNEHRGMSFNGGGMADWRTYLTLPNILKVFNPKLYGYSTANGLTLDRSSRLNIAEPLIMSRDLPFQAAILIDRMRKDPHVNMSQHWKMLTIFVGGNDICSDMCHYENITEFFQMHENDLIISLRMLRDNVPRLLVNLMATPNVAYTIGRLPSLPILCWNMHRVICHCAFSSQIQSAKFQEVSDNMDRFTAVDKRVAGMSEFQRDDFTVVYHPLMTRVDVPTLRNNKTDLRYFGSDCFHFSQLAHAAVANAYFNSLLQPVGKKELGFRPAFEHFACPTAERPYIATVGNC